jgi:hypothetical protein
MDVALENADTMGERIGRIRQIETDFFFCHSVGTFCTTLTHEAAQKVPTE